jgi:hypothetical protein
MLFDNRETVRTVILCARKVVIHIKNRLVSELKAFLEDMKWKIMCKCKLN